VWVARNWCWVFAATVGMVLPVVVEPHVVPWSAAHALARARAYGARPLSPAFARACADVPALRRGVLTVLLRDSVSRTVWRQVGSAKPAAPVSRRHDRCPGVLRCRLACARVAETCR